MKKIKKMNKNITAVIFLIFVISAVFVISFVFSGALILPQTFSLGFFTIHYYGITMASAVAAAFYLAIKRAPKYAIDPKQAEDLLFWLIIGGFIGARFYHVLSSAGYYSQHFTDIFKVWNGGLSIYGALIGGLITLWICRKIFNFQFSIFNCLDWLAPSLLLGQIIGRFGNFFNYEAFGYPTNLPWKMFVPLQFRPDVYQNFNYFHPFFLYEVLGNIIILILLLKLSKNLLLKCNGAVNQENHLYPSRPSASESRDPVSKPSSGFRIAFRMHSSLPEWVVGDARNGTLFFFYLLLYNLLRFGLEFLRIDSTFIGVFRLNAIVSLVLVVISAFVIIRYSTQDIQL